MKQKAKRCPEIKSQVARVPPKGGKVMLRNQKPSGLKAKRDFPVPIDLRPGRVSTQFSSVAQSCPTLCDPMNHNTPGLPVHHQLRTSLRFTSIESVMPSSHLILCRPLLLPPPIPPSISLFQGVNSSHEVAKVLELQL